MIVASELFIDLIIQKTTVENYSVAKGWQFCKEIIKQFFLLKGQFVWTNVYKRNITQVVFFFLYFLHYRENGWSSVSQ